MHSIEQPFFTELDKKFWTAADQLRNALGALVCKHVVLVLAELTDGDNSA